MHTAKQLPSLERLRELFQYDPLTGVVIRKIQTSSRAPKGGVVGTTESKGYKEVKVDGSLFRLHRIIWKLHTGHDPIDKCIDHRNRVRNDNRWDNLRLVTHTENMNNRSPFKKRRR